MLISKLLLCLQQCIIKIKNMQATPGGLKGLVKSEIRKQHQEVSKV